MKTIQAIIYGPPGRGKTTLARSCIGDDRLSPCLILDFEGGVNDSIGTSCRFVDLSEIGKDLHPEKLDVFKITEWTQFDSVYAKLEATGCYKTLIIDSLTEVHKLLLSTISGNARSPTLGAMKMAQLQDYGRASTIIEMLVRRFRALKDTNVLFIAGARYENNPETRETKFFPDVVGKLCYTIGYATSMLGFFGMTENEAGEEVRCLSFKSSVKFEAKVRDEFGTFPTTIMNPTLPMILNYLNGEPNGTSTDKAT